MASDHAHAHAHEWEVSWAPMAAVFGTFFLVIMGFAGFFVYDSSLMAIISAGIGVPLLLAGIAKWIEEGMTHTPLVEGVSVIGLPIFIVSEVFIFLSLFSSYWMMRLKLDDWPPEGTPEINLVIPLIMTVVLVASSFTIHHGEEKLEKGDLEGFRKWLVVTIALGLIFFGFTAYEYQHLAHAGFVPSTNAYSTAFYSITGFHASHVLVGACAFIAVLIPALKGKTNKYFVQCASIYWHFVDIVWFFVVSQVYYW